MKINFVLATSVQIHKFPNVNSPNMTSECYWDESENINNVSNMIIGILESEQHVYFVVFRNKLIFIFIWTWLCCRGELKCSFWENGWIIGVLKEYLLPDIVGKLSENTLAYNCEGSFLIARSYYWALLPYLEALCVLRDPNVTFELQLSPLALWENSTVMPSLVLFSVSIVIYFYCY